MTFAEIERAIASKRRQEQRRASFDYILADLIGRSVARVHNSSNTMPTLAEAYPTLFDKQAEEEEIQAQRDKLSVLRFKQFAQSYNKKYKEVAKDK